MAVGWKSAWLCALAALLAGCSANPHVKISEDWHENLRHQDPDVRVQALRYFADRHDRAATPLLIARLDDEEPWVRMFAYSALKEVTGEKFEFQPYAADSVRAEQVVRWRTWWVQQGGTFPPEPAPAPAPGTAPGAPSPRDRGAKDTAASPASPTVEKKP